MTLHRTFIGRSLCFLQATLCILLMADEGVATPQAGPAEPGRKVYDYYCYQCHGYNGDARTEAAIHLRKAPRNFASTSRSALSRESMIRTVRDGKPGTPMKSFGRVLAQEEIAAVVDYIRGTLMGRSSRRARYHTRENGWIGHERYADAFPFATGAVALDTEWQALTPRQQEGKRLFLSSCVTCHEGARKQRDEPVWESRAVSFPRSPETCDGCHESSRHLHGQSQPPDDLGKAPNFSVHSRAPQVALSPEARNGRTLYLRNCAFCHAADGSGRNWIGTFLEPHPRNLVQPQFLQGRTDDDLAARIRDGLPGASMPAWKGLLAEAEIRSIIRYLREVGPVHSASATDPAVIRAAASSPRLDWRRKVPASR